jgi:hypothetical protein
MGPLFALVIACAPEAPAPDVFAVAPAKGWAGERTDIVIQGAHLLPLVSLGAEDPVGGRFTATLEGPAGVDDPGSVELDAVERIDSDSLAAEVRAGLDPGLYDLVVRTPAGAEAALEGAFRVTRTRADRLAFSADAAAWDLGEFASVTLGVLAPDETPVFTDLPVEVVASSRAGAVGVEFAAGQLGEQVSLDDAVGIRGTLGADGSATLLVRSTIADDVVLTAHAVEEGGVDDATILLSWQAGSLASLDLSLPFSPFRAQAHVPFTVHLALRDAFGNLLPDTAARVSVTDDCDGFRKIVDLVGEADIEITLDTACEANRITIFNNSGEVQSDAFEVVAGDMVAYRVTAAPTTNVRAGLDPVLVAVESIDTWGNLVEMDGEVLTLSDTLAGLDPRSSCPALSAGVALCTAWLRRAGSDTFTVTDDGGRVGHSNAVEVIPDAAASLDVVPATVETVAGNELVAVVTVLDALGNVVEIEPGGVDAVSFSDDTGTISCDWSGPVGDGSQAFLCTITAASPADILTAAVARLGVENHARETVRVYNAELADVSVSAPAGAVAGAAFVLTVQGFDRYGNPYTRQTDPTVHLGDTTGTLVPASATLGASGETTVSAVITGADPAVRVVASQYGIPLGTSAPFAVSAGSPASFEVDTPPWSGVGEDLPVEVTAVDGWGNPVGGYAGSVVLSSTGDACGTGSTVTLSAGVASASMLCDDVRLGARISATDGTLSGDSALVDIVDFECAAAPTATLLLDGTTDPAVCLAAGTATVDVDATTSSSSAGLVLYSFADGDDERIRNATGTGAYTWADAGPRYVQALVVDAFGCADETDGWAWLGEDDGEPTGPVALSASASSVTTGGSVTVTAVARDCTGDLAVGQTLLVRADLGEPGGTASGGGLGLVLDAAGEVAFPWSFPAGFADTATLHVGTASAGGYGNLSVEVSQDSARPHVIDVEPAGEWSGEVAEIVVTFDEAILASTVSAVTLTGPAGVVATTATLEGATLRLTPDSPVDADAGTWVIDVPSSVRDEAGNRLDGGWTGGADAASVRFGDVGTALPTTAGCAIASSTFRPDGDDGAGEEADTVTITPVSSASPTWWELRVSDPTGSRVRTLRSDGAAATIAWDGRTDSGLVAPAGSYTLAVYAVDTTDNRAIVCAPTATLAQRLELP